LTPVRDFHHLGIPQSNYPASVAITEYRNRWRNGSSKTRLAQKPGVTTRQVTVKKPHPRTPWGRSGPAKEDSLPARAPGSPGRRWLAMNLPCHVRPLHHAQAIADPERGRNATPASPRILRPSTAAPPTTLQSSAGLLAPWLLVAPVPCSGRETAVARRPHPPASRRGLARPRQPCRGQRGTGEDRPGQAPRGIHEHGQKRRSAGESITPETRLR